MNIYQMPKVERLGSRRDHGVVSIAPKVRVDEKIDGSQISFGVLNGELWVRSKTRFINVTAPDGMFRLGVDAIKAHVDTLPEGFTFVGEYLQKPKHNVLAYDRVPKNHIVVFDIVDPEGNLLPYQVMRALIESSGVFEPVTSTEMSGEEAIKFASTMDAPLESQLGGHAEGVVIKVGDTASNRLNVKVVTDQFREVKQDNTTRTRKNPGRDVTLALANKFCPAARFHKAVQRLKEDGIHQGKMSDIGPLRKALSVDIETECKEEIKEELYQYFRKEILKSSLAPLAAWYEQYLTNDNAYWSSVRERTGE